MLELYKLTLLLILLCMTCKCILVYHVVTIHSSSIWKTEAKMAIWCLLYNIKRRLWTQDENDNLLNLQRKFQSFYKVMRNRIWWLLHHIYVQCILVDKYMWSNRTHCCKCHHFYMDLNDITSNRSHNHPPVGMFKKLYQHFLILCIYNYDTVKPSWHWQEYPFASSLHTPLFTHGFGKHSSISVSQCCP